jgi:hypothetical protein
LKRFDQTLIMDTFWVSVVFDFNERTLKVSVVGIFESNIANDYVLCLSFLSKVRRLLASLILYIL